MWFRGAKSFDAGLDLLLELGMNKAELIVFTGGSAGGLTVFLVRGEPWWGGEGLVREMRDSKRHGTFSLTGPTAIPPSTSTMWRSA